MQWMIIQLTPWAEKTLRTGELAQEIRRRTSTPDLELYYGVVEDAAGKHRTAYSEYLFVEDRPYISLTELEGNEIFRTILRDPKGQPRIIDDGEVQRVRQQVEAEERINVGEIVIVNEGPLRGNQGTVLLSDDGQVHLEVSVGDETQHAVIPTIWCRRRGRKRKK